MKNQENFSIGIIGGGAAGTSIAHYLIQELGKTQISTTFKIDVYEKRGIFGPGLAFERDNDALLMNMVSQDASLFADDSGSFWRWLSKTSHQEYKQYVIGGSAMAPNGFVPRGLFGSYMSFMFDQIEIEAKNVGIDFCRRHTEIREIAKTDMYELVTANGVVHRYNLVVLCTGNSEPLDIFGLLGHSRYINNPYPVRSYMAKMPPNSTVGIIGSQLTAADVAIVLAQSGHKGKITLLSRTSELPSIRSVLRPHTLKHVNLKNLNSMVSKRGGHISLRDILRLLRKEFLAIGEDWRSILFRSTKEISPKEYFERGLNSAIQEQAWQSIMVAMDHVIENYWQSLSDNDKSYFMSKIHRQWNSKRAPLPVTTAYKLNALMLDGQLSFCSGLTNMSISDNEKFLATASCEDTRSNVQCERNLEFDWIINATGPARHINELEGGIFSDLINSGLAQKSQHGGISVDFDTSAVIDSSGRVNGTIYAVGQPANGTYYFVSSLEMVSLRAKSTAKAIAKFVNNSTNILINERVAKSDIEVLDVV
jgi:uncharacterized NAD(P)/FAD-binding protein YdhS